MLCSHKHVPTSAAASSDFVLVELVRPSCHAKALSCLGFKSNFSASVGSSSAVLIFLRGLSLALSHDATQKANVYRRMPSILALPLRHGSSPGQTVCGDKAFRCSSCLPWACLPGRGKGCWVLQSCLHTHQVFIWLKQATRRASGPMNCTKMMRRHLRRQLSHTGKP